MQTNVAPEIADRVIGLKREMELYDDLPPVLRLFLQEAPFKYGADQIRGLFMQGYSLTHLRTFAAIQAMAVHRETYGN